MFKINNNNTRAHGSLIVPKIKTTRDAESFYHGGAKLWNSIPLDIRNSVNVTKFTFTFMYKSFLYQKQIINTSS